MTSSDESKKNAWYDNALEESRDRIRNSRNWISNCANVSAILYESFADSSSEGPSAGKNRSAVNWAGFYMLRRIESSSAPSASVNASSSCTTPYNDPKQSMLFLGPFHGKAAVDTIAYGKGVCGTAVAEAATQVVPDTHQHPNHIACDDASRSEIVVPMFVSEQQLATERQATAASSTSSSSSSASTSSSSSPSLASGADLRSSSETKGADGSSEAQQQTRATHMLGVLDIDSPFVGTFDEVDARRLAEIVDVLVRGSDWWDFYTTPVQERALTEAQRGNFTGEQDTSASCSARRKKKKDQGAH